jgi:hypothetical protein
MAARNNNNNGQASLASEHAELVHDCPQARRACWRLLFLMKCGAKFGAKFIATESCQSCETRHDIMFLCSTWLTAFYCNMQTWNQLCRQLHFIGNSNKTNNMKGYFTYLWILIKNSRDWMPCFFLCSHQLTDHIHLVRQRSLPLGG